MVEDTRTPKEIFDQTTKMQISILKRLDEKGLTNKGEMYLALEELQICRKDIPLSNPNVALMEAAQYHYTMHGRAIFFVGDPRMGAILPAI